MNKHLLILCIAIALAGAIPGSSFELELELSDISVEGVVYCRCNLTGYATRVDASPLSGIVASLKCDVGNNYHTLVNATTDYSGYFQVSAKMIKKYMRHCSVYVLSSPLSQCIVPSQLTFAGKGSKLIYEREVTGVGSQYSAGLMLIGPSSLASCHV